MGDRLAYFTVTGFAPQYGRQTAYMYPHGLPLVLPLDPLLRTGRNLLLRPIPRGKDSHRDYELPQLQHRHRLRKRHPHPPPRYPYSRRNRHYDLNH
jgi:hypothetical protein